MLQRVRNKWLKLLLAMKKKRMPKQIELELHWTGGSNENGRNDFQVLQGLQPHQNLERLEIHEYAGATFPSWIMSPGTLLPNLVRVVLQDCGNCERLPPLGLLPSLKVLEIDGLGAVKSIGSEFYGDGSSFASLEELSIVRMDHLVDWSDHVSSSASSSFPRLERLSISLCFNLRSMPTRFPSIKKLYFHRSNGEPISSLVERNLSSLSDIYIEECEELVSLPCALLKGNNILTRLEVWTCEKFEGFVPKQDLEEKVDDEVPNTCLDTLQFDHCPGFNDCLQLRGFNSLRVLCISNCGKSLKRIPNGIQYLPKLDELTIGPLSDELNSFPFPAAMVDDQGTVMGDYFPSLSEITISGWSNLQTLPDDLQHITSLQKLCIWDFQSMVALPEWMGNFASLRLLGVRRCGNLEYLPSLKQMQRLASLQILHIAQCEVLEDRCVEGGEEHYKISHVPIVDYSPYNFH